MTTGVRIAVAWLAFASIIGLGASYFRRAGTNRALATGERHAATAGTPAGYAAPASVTAAVPAVDGHPADASATTAPFVAATAATVTAPAARKPSAAEARAARKPSARKPSAKAAPLDLAAAKVALGATVKLDDFKLIEGIGPRIETLFKADGITSWRELSKANVERLQGVLDAAGPRYKVQNPGSWPKQAGLLADGKWADFKTLTDNLKGGT